jgi:hypothetical protein
MVMFLRIFYMLIDLLLIFIQLEKKEMDQALVAHICIPSYSGGREQEDCTSKPAWENSSQDPISKIPNTKQGWWSGSSGRVY